MICIKKTIIFLAFFIAALMCIPVNAAEETADDVAVEIVEHSEELIGLCVTIHDETEKIADDKSLDQDLRELAEGIHVCSHELESIAEHINEHALELQNIVASGTADSVAIAEAVNEIKEHCGEFSTMVEAKHEEIHDLVFSVPESHEDYADATHDAAHEAGEVAEHIIKHTSELETIVAAEPATASAKTTLCTTNGDVTVKVTEIKGYSDELFSSAESILLDTKAIVKDDTVDQEIRDLAKTIHLVSHKLEDIGADLQEDSAELETLTADPTANEAAIKALIAKMETNTANYTAMLQEQHENIHELVFVAPESREDNADAVHDNAHSAEDIADHLSEQLTGFTTALNTPAGQTTQSQATLAPATAKTSAPGFSALLALCAVLGTVACLVRRK
ncbi:hypothetical protein [Methanoplanus endosymbiosus]|uniref:PGF-CTERM sorting domain-containing protein n=1 Tax=Methanoplanus endosymbiosus TaxID=33865 RepID=A0A9E7PKQ8_9EURY|nr:hypothetical protein [Methanoplanus endosymbiosus]UUX91958.1 hypothetical protein L6E24_11410 [Methanoplanus endosymbiosus]